MFCLYSVVPLIRADFRGSCDIRYERSTLCNLCCFPLACKGIAHDAGLSGKGHICCGVILVASTHIGTKAPLASMLGTCCNKPPSHPFEPHMSHLNSPHCRRLVQTCIKILYLHRKYNITNIENCESCKNVLKNGPSDKTPKAVKKRFVHPTSHVSWCQGTSFGR